MATETKVKKTKKAKKKVELIPVEQVSTCPSFSDYHFSDKCCIQTCQYYTERTARHCLALDRTSGDIRSFTDKELRYFKCSGSTLRDVSGKRRAGVNAIRNIASLHLFIEYIRENYKAKATNISVDLDSLISTSNLRFKRLKFHSWMLVHLVDDNLFETFKRKEGIPSDVTLSAMLGLTRADYKQFIALSQKSLPK